MSTHVLDVRPMRPADEPEVLDLLNTTMAGSPAGPWTAEFFRWKHRNSPFGASPTLVSVHDDTLVGVRLFLRWELACGSSTVSAVRAVDTATHPDYQRQGIFKRLTLELLDQVELEGADLVFNTPNADSRPGYLKLGWQEVGLLPVHVSPVRPLAFLRGARGASTANSSGSASAVAGTSTPATRRECPLPPAAAAFADPDELSDLLVQVAPTHRLHTRLTPEYLRWRYVDAPGLDYRCVRVEQGGRLVGLAFGRARQRAALVELTLGDVIVREGDRRTARRVLRSARRSGVDHVAVHASHGTEIAGQLGRSGYLRAPGHGIGLVANPRDAMSPDVFDAASWRLSLGDLEVF